MDGNSPAEKLQRIQELWTQLEQVSPSAPEYEGLLKQIRTLSAEYQALTNLDD
jgi:hypothetical protein